jgi:hypothetical protein
MATPDQTTPATPDRCPSCGAAMAPDQRYCLSCGVRRGAPRVAATPADGTPAAPVPTTVAQQRPGDVSPLAAVIGIALLGGMLLIGVLIGRSGSDDTPAPAPIVQVDSGTTPGATTTTPTTPATPPPATGAVTTDWPTDAQGFTIQLSVVPKQGATQDIVDAAKQAATSNGAANVGALDSDLYASLDPGNYVIYSGRYSTRKPAVSALGKLGAGFPDATVIEVGPGAKDTAGTAAVPGANGGTGEVAPPPPGEGSN